MDIRCRQTKCKFNNGQACVLKELVIKDGTGCANFEDDPNKKGELASKTMFENKPEFAPFHHCKEMNINCEADCLFNKKGKCIANGITVLRDDACANCGTFFKKPEL